MIHIVTRFKSLAGGTEWRALGLYELLRTRADVILWSEGAPCTGLPHAPRVIDAASGGAPSGGTLVLAGVFWDAGDWLGRLEVERCVVIYNTYSPRRLDEVLARLKRGGVGRVELVYASETLRAMEGRPGTVQLSPFPVERFVPGSRPRESFTVGRLSRDAPKKHHPEDTRLYAELARAGCRVRIMGGERTLGALAGTPGVELLPANAEPAEEFLRSLDCFVFRTHPEWFEALARCVTEAMCCALPVVCDDIGGHRELIDDGVNGFIARDTGEACAMVLRLKNDPPLRHKVGQAARAAVLERHSPQKLHELADFYVG